MRTLEERGYVQPRKKIVKRKAEKMNISIGTDTFIEGVATFLESNNKKHDRLAYIGIGIATSYFFIRFLVAILFEI